METLLLFPAALVIGIAVIVLGVWAIFCIIASIQWAIDHPEDFLFFLGFLAVSTVAGYLIIGYFQAHP